MNYYTDSHVHTSFSDDCNTPMEDMVKKAISLGLKEIVFTDHVDYDYPDSNFPFMINYDEYLKVFNDIKEKYKKNIKLLLGVEIGYQKHIKENIEKLLSKYEFDFLICSTHVGDKLDFCNGDFFKGKNQKEAYLRYFENVLESVKHFNNYDVYGHLDFIVRYGDFEVKKLNYKEYKDIIDEILKVIVHNGKGIEVNTSGYRYNLNHTHPQIDIIRRYKELGGEIITVGSDSHFTKDLCSDFNMAYNILRSVGFKRIATFKEREPYFIDIA